MKRRFLKGAVGPPGNDSRFLVDVHRRDLPAEDTMARYDDSDEVDLVVVGAGAGGSVLAQRLARRGWRVVIIEAGPFWHPDEDWVSDEAGSHHLYWNEKRIIGGNDPIEMGQNNSSRGVGGSMVHYAGYCPRFHPSDFDTFFRDGVGADWPIAYGDLRDHYERVEAGRARGVAYIREGDRTERLQRSKVVAVACYSIETPRLLLNSRTARRAGRADHPPLRPPDRRCADGHLPASSVVDRLRQSRAHHHGPRVAAGRPPRRQPVGRTSQGLRTAMASPDGTDRRTHADRNATWRAASRGRWTSVLAPGLCTRRTRPTTARSRPGPAGEHGRPGRRGPLPMLGQVARQSGRHAARQILGFVAAALHGVAALGQRATRWRQMPTGDRSSTAAALPQRRRRPPAPSWKPGHGSWTALTSPPSSRTRLL